MSPNLHHQKGAVFLIMIVILSLGVITALVATLSKVSLQTARNNKSSDLLAQAKDVVIGYALNGSGGSQRPGDLMRPDVAHESTTTDYDGTSDGCLNVTKPNGLPLTTTIANLRCLGRLPWKDYGLALKSTSQSDPTGFMPWYAVSSNLMDPDTVAVKLNSELLNDPPPHPWLTVRDMNGNVLSNRVVFVLIIPGVPLPGQSRPASPLGGADQYLDSITVAVGCSAPCVPGTYNNADMDDSFIMGDERRWIDDPANPGKQLEDSSYNFNDKLLFVTIDELMPLIEKRIAREVKNCLDDYAASSSSKYPWAAPISPLDYTSTPNTRFGRIPDVPIALIPSPDQQLDANNATGAIKTMLDAMAALQTAATNCESSYSSTKWNALRSAGAALEAAADAVANAQPTVPAIDSNTVTDFAITAGEKAQDTFASPVNDRCNRIANYGSTSVQSNLANANSGLVGIMTPSPPTQEDSTMASTWPAGCFVSGNMANYWDQWKQLVLYQVSDNYRPQSSGAAATACGVTGTCLSINGSGNPNAGSGSYRAAVIMAGKKLTNITPAQTRAAQSASEYLELNNKTNRTDAPSNLALDTYKPSDASYSTVNDLVQCVDGKTKCE